jgi:hypothetical protein
MFYFLLLFIFFQTVNVSASEKLIVFPEIDRSCGTNYFVAPTTGGDFSIIKPSNMHKDGTNYGFFMDTFVYNRFRQSAFNPCLCIQLTKNGYKCKNLEHKDEYKRFNCFIFVGADVTIFRRDGNLQEKKVLFNYIRSIFSDGTIKPQAKIANTCLAMNIALHAIKKQTMMGGTDENIFQKTVEAAIARPEKVEYYASVVYYDGKNKESLPFYDSEHDLSGDVYKLTKPAVSDFTPPFPTKGATIIRSEDSDKEFTSKHFFSDKEFTSKHFFEDDTPPKKNRSNKRLYFIGLAGISIIVGLIAHIYKKNLLAWLKK